MSPPGPGASIEWGTVAQWASLVVALVALAVSVLSFSATRLMRVIAIDLRYSQQISEVNDSFHKYGVVGQYGRARNLDPKDKARVTEFAGKCAVLFQQINLLRFIYTHREALGPLRLKRLPHIKDWVSADFFQWVFSDPDSSFIYERFKQVDIDDPQFVEWLRKAEPPSKAS